ncbi:tether containing UBX domain for GLUT4 [Adelges cooleyi]|uniref:tether containing UBX domain for GLUT4 n=1 Tax=Adelges cooleyi TaxID=133065 RepID=UPI0021805563|nr:tether containing UBX domain for GLUT4 [Adelges cooleyi]
MATSLVILGDNAARITVKVNPNMTILNVLELACTKWKVDSNNYDLKYHNKILDTTSLIRFTNIANNALLELVPVAKSRINSPVGIWLQLEDGSRLTGEFTPNQSLWDVIQSILKENAANYDSPAIIYTRMEIIGKEQLQKKSLKDIGLVGGKALLRLLNKSESVEQAHVYVPPERKPKIEESSQRLGHRERSPIDQSNNLGNLEKLKEEVQQNQETTDINIPPKTEAIDTCATNKTIENKDKKNKKDINPKLSDEDLNNFKSTIKYLDERETLLFDMMDGTFVTYKDEGDDFYEPTVKDVTLVMRDLKSYRSQLEDGQLCTNAMRVLQKTQNQLNLLYQYKKCIVRVHFPNRLVLQSVFKSTENVSDVISFLRKYLVDGSMEFHLFTAPPKIILNPEETLLECGCVPSAMVHFSSMTESDHLKPELREKIVSANQASIAAYLVRKERAKNSKTTSNEVPHDEAQQNPGPSRKSNQEIKQKPKWFKP